MVEKRTVRGQGEGELRGQSAERQPVAFNVASDVYGVDAGTARESARMQEITHVPDTRELEEGAIDLPDNAIPLNDFRTQVHYSLGGETKNAPHRRRGHRRRGHRRGGHRNHRQRRDRGYAAGRRRDRSAFDDGFD